MSKIFQGLEPERLWHYFEEILKIPRPSKKEEKIAAWLLKTGKDLGLETLQDETGNILIRKPASPGMENKKTVVLQSHIDMVGEKNSDKDHDFEKDPIEAYVEDGWVKARGTTLGADDGIGMAAQLALLESKDIAHPPIECLFTVDEETGLSGAFGLKPGFLRGEILLNLDSEDDGELFIGCAGGKDTLIDLPLEKTEISKDHETYAVKVSGLMGGHSGDDIHKGRGNANKILNRLLWESAEKFGIRISSFDGGNLRNAIAREAQAVVMVPVAKAAGFEELAGTMERRVKKEFHATDPDVRITFEKTGAPAFLLTEELQEKLLNSLYACPHGVIAMSQDIAGFVETSTNLASVKFREDSIRITTSQRSSVESAKDNICNMVTAVFRLAGAAIEHTDGYPGWSPDPDSIIVEITANSYRALFNEEPIVRAVHAGLECGLIGDKYPGMDMISFGPTIRGAHSPDERLDISTVVKFWDLLIDVLSRTPDKEL